MKDSVLFLCTNNSCRSQMAEALLRRHTGHRFEVFSAGLRPREIHPLTYRVMAEIGIDISGQRPKGFREFFRRVSVGYAIIVCERFQSECPRLFPGALEILYWPFDDPAAATGSEEEQLDRFREVRDQIDERIRSWLEERP